MTPHPRPKAKSKRCLIAREKLIDKQMADAERMLRLLRRGGKGSLKRDYFWCGWNEGHRAGVRTATLEQVTAKAPARSTAKKGRKR